MSHDPKNFLNRELSWLAFNFRVLDQAIDEETPLLEKLKFLSIAGSNLDEFFMVRVAGLKKMLQEDIESPDYHDRPDLKALFVNIKGQVDALLKKQEECFLKTVVPGLKSAGVELHNWDDLGEDSKKHLTKFFNEDVFPVLTPLAVDPAHPFPFLSNMSMYLVVQFKKQGGPTKAHSIPLGFVEIPTILPRLVKIPGKSDKHEYILLDDLITAHLKPLFLGFDIEQTHRIRVTRNLDYTLLENEVVDLLKTIQSELVNRSHQEAVRLEVQGDIPERLLQTLKAALWLDDEDVYRTHAPLHLKGLMSVYDLPFEQLRDPTFNPRIPKSMEATGDIFSLISSGDILVHHPYESFYAVIELLNSAAIDPHVFAIKQTLYRTSGDSPIIDALIAAAENGKQVTAVVELKARFDEKNNIVWARRMERAGVNVVFGFVGLKTHGKATLIVRQEKSKLVRYVHLSTGNYNSSSAKLYTDIGLFTKNDEIGGEISALFNLLTGFNVLSGDFKQPKGVLLPHFKRLGVAPLDLKQKVIALIDREIESHKKTSNGRIIAKMNALVDRDVIKELYRASSHGVKITLIIRGICCLRPGVAGVSEHIEVISIIDRFLEHSRIFYFANGGQEEVFLSSADWMTRNFERRIEIMFPILDDKLKRRIVDEVLALCLADNTHAYELRSDGTYHRRKPKLPETAVRCQQKFIELAREGGLKSIPYDKAMRFDSSKTRGTRPVAKRGSQVKKD